MDELIVGRIIGLLICFKNHKTLLIVYKRVTVPIGNTFSGVQHSMDRVTYFHQGLTAGNFLIVSSGLHGTGLPMLVIICLRVESFVAGVTFRRTRSPMLNLLSFTF